MGSCNAVPHLLNLKGIVARGYRTGDSSLKERLIPRYSLKRTIP